MLFGKSPAVNVSSSASPFPFRKSAPSIVSMRAPRVRPLVSAGLPACVNETRQSRGRALLSTANSAPYPKVGAPEKRASKSSVV